MMTQAIIHDMKRVYQQLGNTRLEYRLLLSSRELDFVVARHIVRVLMRKKHKASLSQIARAESTLIGRGKKINHTTIMNSEDAYQDWIIRDHSVLVGLIWKVVYEKQRFDHEAITEALSSLAEVD